MLRFVSAVLLIAATPGGEGAAQSRRPLQPDDIFELKSVGDARISPDGAWVAYTVTTLDRKEDNSDTDIYMVSTSGGAPLQLTTTPTTRPAPRRSRGRLTARSWRCWSPTRPGGSEGKSDSRTRSRGRT